MLRDKVNWSELAAFWVSESPLVLLDLHIVQE
jgi:hypothetical protein